MENLASPKALLLHFNAARAIRANLGSCIVCVLLLACALHALDPNKHVSQYIHNSWRSQDGSAPAGMLSIAQSSDGFLWFSTLSQQIYRFDGVRFVSWRLPSKGGSTTKLFKVFGDHAVGVWALGNNDIVHFKGGIVTSQIELEGLQSFQLIAEGADGSVWVVRAANTVSDGPLCHVTNYAVKCFGKADGIPITPIDSLLADGKGGFWLGGQTTLVHWHDGISETYPVEALKSNAGQHGILRLALAPDGTLWVGILAQGPGLGLGQFKHGAVKPFVTPIFDGSKVEVQATVFDHDGNFWVATAGNGIYRIHENAVEHYGRAEGLSSDTVFDVFEDREGILWAATTNGIDSFRDARVTTFSATEGLGKDAAVGVLASKDGSIWVANDGSLDDIANGVVSSIRTGTGLPGHQVTSLLEDRAGNLWVGVDDGLYVLKDGRFRHLPELNHQPLGTVFGLTEDKDGNVWAECVGNERKLVRIRDFAVREEFPTSQVPAGRLLVGDPEGGIWIETAKGDLAHYRDGTVQKFSLQPRGTLIPRQIVAVADGSVLIASENGLMGLRNGKLQRMTTENGLPCNSMVSLIQDNEKRWWLYADCGVIELADSEVRGWWGNRNAIVHPRVYDVLDGARPGRPAFNSAALSPDGRVWFANGTVVQMVDPSRISLAGPAAATFVDSVTVDRKEFKVIDHLTLPPHPRELQIDYTSPTFLIPQRVKFRYRLEGYDHDWHDAGTRRQAFYTDLPPGKYSFRVIAANSDGVWSDSAAKLDFSVAPAYYQTNWFRALCAIAFLALLWAVYRWRVWRLRHEFEMTLDARVGERTRIARDLHDTLLQSFHGVLLRFQAVFQLLPEQPVHAKEKLGSAIEQAAEAITEGRDAVQGLRDSTVQSNDLALAIGTLGEELATDTANHRPAFRVAVEGQSRNLHPILRDEIYKIAAEALRNAFHHARAKQIEVEIRYDNEQFRLRVRDDGKGMDPAILSSQSAEGHYGLPGIRERAKIMGARLTVWSEVDAGTEVELRLPAKLAYTTVRKSSWWSRAFAAKAKG